jgi:hypothetical protein
LDQDIKDIPVLVDSAPQVVTLAVNGEEDLIEMPLIAGFGATVPELIGIPFAELLAPLSGRLIVTSIPRAKSESSTSR